MKKFCIFCGRTPESKNKEHVIPQWLIKHTGDPKRKVPLGVYLNSGKDRFYSFDQFQFPACGQCNSRFGALETQARPIIVKLLKEQSLASNELSIILSWFDKVRIGLWLAYLLLDKDPFGVSPHFHIETRIDLSDRMLLIYKISGGRRGIQFSGVQTPFFYHCPTCFGLRINQFYFLNIATDFLFSRRLGLPYPVERILTKKYRTLCRMKDGQKRVMFPLIRKPFDTRCKEIYQPGVNPKNIKRLQHKTWYDDDYVRKYFDMTYPFLGKVLITYQNDIKQYPDVATKEWIPEDTHTEDVVTRLIIKQVLSLQNWLLDDMPSIDYLAPEYKKRFKLLRDNAKRFNRLLIKTYTR